MEVDTITSSVNKREREGDNNTIPTNQNVVAEGNEVVGGGEQITTTTETNSKKRKKSSVAAATPENEENASNETWEQRIKGIFWGKMAGYPHWPCVIPPIDALRTQKYREDAEKAKISGKHLVFWLKDEKYSTISAKSLIRFVVGDSNFEKFKKVAETSKNKKQFLAAIEEASAFNIDTYEGFKPFDLTATINESITKTPSKKKTKSTSHSDTVSSSKKSTKATSSSTSSSTKNDSASASELSAPGVKRKRAIVVISDFVQSLPPEHLVDYVVRKMRKAKKSKKEKKKRSKKSKEETISSLPVTAKEATKTASVEKKNSSKKSDKHLHDQEKSGKNSESKATSANVSRASTMAISVTAEKKLSLENEAEDEKFLRYMKNLGIYTKAGSDSYDLSKAVKTLEKLKAFKVTEKLLELTEPAASVMISTKKSEIQDHTFKNAAKQLLSKWKSDISQETN